MNFQQLLASFKILIAGFHSVNTNTGECDVKLWDWSVSVASLLPLRSRDQALFKSLYSHSDITYISCNSKTAQLLYIVRWDGESTQYNCWLRKLQRHFCARCLGFLGFCFCGICFYLALLPLYLGCSFPVMRTQCNGRSDIDGSKIFSCFCFGCCYTLWCCCCW